MSSTNYLVGDKSTSWRTVEYRLGMIDSISIISVGDKAMELKTFGQRLRWARQNHAKITQTELAKKMKEEQGVPIGKNYISELEKEEAKKRPSFEMVRAMAAAMNVSLDFFGRFTELLEPVHGKEQSPHYFSEEADEVAQLVDAMKPEQRVLVLNLARNITAPTERERRQSEVKDILDSIERELGRDTRVSVERVLRSRGLAAPVTAPDHNETNA